MQRHVASFNIGAIRYPFTDARMAEFTSNLERINQLGDKSRGFVWRRPPTDDTDFCEQRFGNRQMLLNLTVWETVEDLDRFVWKTIHKQFFNRRTEWFLESSEPSFVMWWVAPGRIPSIDEAADRLTSLRSAGESEQCFGWRHANEQLKTRGGAA
jgi:Domain of unknown function (DUF3291)